ncbi:MAG: UDP-glucose/GDP-mannose dehydrogenase family protein [Phycisphaerales bacterium]|nr:UDP-glucose/GDP-mannose dehydrogenase family protein [Phycisphaerales bacterium]
MGKPKVGCVGGGVVGSAMQKLCGQDTVIYDIRPPYDQNKKLINQCDVVFVAVPTNMRTDGSCDTTIVEETVAWIEAPLIIIRSTITPGTTDRLREKYRKHIVFQPEYLGETTAHVFGNMAEREFAVLGGTTEDVSMAADFYKHYYNAYCRYYFCDAITAEVAKYMENAFYAVKVTFVNEFYDIAKAHGVDFNILREIWLADPRISRDHTFVYPWARGFSGKCLPKDCNAIVHSSQGRGYTPQFMKATLEINEHFLKKNEKKV